MVSIHAPAWGATGPGLRDYQRHKRFQSTRPRGARHGYVRDAPAAGSGFNPRARVGRDLEIWLPVNAAGVFQSTRPRGARRGIMCAMLVGLKFQSTRPRGARP